MRILWLCNVMIPIIGMHLNRPFSNEGGWLTGLLDEILQSDESALEMAICFPISFDTKIIKGKVQSTDYKKSVQYFGFPVYKENGQLYDPRTEADLNEVIKEFKPDIVHIFGTEFPHSLAMARVFNKKQRILLGIQGIMSVCAREYEAGLPEKIVNRYTFRDWLKKDRIIDAKHRFLIRAQYEKETIEKCIHIAGRTKFDFNETLKMNPKRQYHLLNESLRDMFYQNRWVLKEADRHSIFISQGYYPLKGLHFIIEALPEILQQFPDATLFVAGDRIIPESSIKGYIKTSSYGKYIKDLLEDKKIKEHVFFLGSLDTQKMCERYKKSHVFVSASVIENSPNSVGEAMLLGMPVVSSDVGGVSDFITCKEEGILVESANVSAFAKGIMDVFANDEKTVHMGECAHQRAIGLYDKGKNLNQLMEIYQTIGKIDEK